MMGYFVFNKNFEPLVIMRKKKKMLIKGITPKPRNPIARILCTDTRFKTRTFKNKKKTIEKFDWKKEDF
ncbi:hypothetical protein QUW23_08690 [Parasutterella secunda]|nr:hypothetical protein [Parasutterella secunda]